MLTHSVTRALLDGVGDSVVVVLAFHGVLPEGELRRLPLSLRRHFLSLSEFLRTLRAFRSLGFEYARLRDLLAFLKVGRRQRPLRTRMAVITFDDGYESIARHAFPVLQSQRVPFVVCAISSCLESREMLWTNRVRLLRYYAAGLVNGLIGGQDLKRLPHSQRTELLRLCESRLEEAGCEVPIPQAYRPLSLDELQRLRQSGLVDVVFHTRTHPVLSTVESIAAVEEECSADNAEWVTCKEVFCIPNGLSTDFTPRVVDVLRQHGYQHWFTTEPGFVSNRSGVEEIPRIVARQTCFRTMVEVTQALYRHLESSGRRGPSPQLRWALHMATRLS